ncbi:ANTAR domain-containing protein [Pedococcus bigeumensis]|uniref:ANTAR domain-containing protein n=1 Tax=Pedococcus bigeumensis TaxID=433644 RepID=A0A502CYW4_9MICO|nr:ANTAR domain-containing protein [Pedococcus bigeumensis]TPG17832.1 ANTAR domain-containing protein [Pedococcus bigeumensis]
MAAQAAVALGQAQRENDMVMALQSSRTIGKAVGLVMERFDLDDHEAFVQLVKWSEKADVRLRDLATHMVKQSNDLRHVTTATQPSDREQSPGVTLVGRPDAVDDRGLDALRERGRHGTGRLRP